MSRSRSYFWALQVPYGSRLSDNAADGLEYAIQLADQARMRRQQVLRHERAERPFTFEELGEIRGASAATVRRRISLARTELFGNLSDSGIYYRLRREKQLRQRPRRLCGEAGCSNALPWNSSAARRYCDTHNTPAARVARHRRRHQPTR